MRDLTYERERAMEHAVALSTARRSSGPQAVKQLRVDATEIFNWLIGPAALSVTTSPVRDQKTGQPTGNPSKGSKMQITNGEEYDLVVDVSDVKGVDIPDDPGTTADDISWTIDPPTGVATLRISADSRTCTVVGDTQGSGVVTMTLGELVNTNAVDVVHSAAAKVNVTEGPARPQATV